MRSASASPRQKAASCPGDVIVSCGTMIISRRDAETRRNECKMQNVQCKMNNWIDYRARHFAFCIEHFALNILSFGLCVSAPLRELSPTLIQTTETSTPSAQRVAAKSRSYI